MLLRLIGGDLEALARDALGEFCRRARQGPVVPLAVGLKRAHLVSDPALVRHVLLDNVANYDKVTPAFDAVRVVLGNGMLTSAGSFWKRQRRIAQPALHGESVKRFGPILTRMAAETADQWEEAARAGATIDACTDMMRVTLRAVAETLFGDDLGDSAAEINRVFPTILMAARDEETGESMSDAQLRDEVMTMMIAGHETTANALSWLWVLLDRHPDEQERLRAELVAVTGGRSPTVDDVANLPRLKAVIQETLRLYPPVWMFDRRALGPDDLGGTRVRAGDLVIFVPYAIHRLPQLWSDPEAFRPARFEPGREEQKNKFAYLPFGAGPRICLGASFAMIESQIIVGTLLARFRVRLADPAPVTPTPQVTLRTSRPVLLRLERAPLA